MGYCVILPDDSSLDFVNSDLTLSETHTNEAQVTEHAVEEGTDISDNVRQLPQVYEAEVYVTNTPIALVRGFSAPGQTGHGGEMALVTVPMPVYKAPFLGTPGDIFRKIDEGLSSLFGATDSDTLSVTSLQFPTVFDSVLEHHIALVKLQELGASLTVFTSTRTYKSMVLEGVGLRKEEKGGGTFGLRFKQIRTVQTQNVSAPKPSTPRGNPTQAKGSQATKPGDKEPGAVSVLAQLKDTVKGALGI